MASDDLTQAHNTDDKKPSKRRRILVDRTFQFRFISSFLFSVLGGLFVVSGLFVAYYWFSSMEGLRRADEIITIDTRVFQEMEVENEAGEMETQMVATTKTVTGKTRWEIVLPPLMLNNLFIMLIAVGIGLLLSSRIAGPVLHIQRVLKDFRSGKKGTRIQLRKRDSLKNLAEDIHGLLDDLERK